MKKMLLLCVAFAGILLLIRNMGGAKGEIEWRTNSGLPTLKEGWRGNIVIGGRFRNDSLAEGASSFRDVMRWKLGRNPQRDEKRRDTFRVRVESLGEIPLAENSVVWLGQASFLITVGGVRLATDPCYFDLPLNRRLVAMPCSADSLPPVDYLLVSHSHRDHFDRRSAEALLRTNPAMEALVPLGGDRLFSGRALSGIRRQEAGWYQEYHFADGLRVIFLPARHWGRRGLFDTNRTLWGSFLIIADDVKIFFAGDTGYDRRIFREVRELFGNIDICLLPIGAYSPQFVMKRSHMTPEEAVQAFLDMGGGMLVPMHYGTYDLSDEPLGEPLQRLWLCAAALGIENRVKALAVGEILKF
ncbi:MAG: MBL fold metallo-hydrolase [Rikenellaceae bacterium]|nr:MBL fold metallo-hydrolase [Rikenellaceae bacterium]MCL2693177.1 MBL fold metallo-hydrolase [Rikenellaceae bacterium]